MSKYQYHPHGDKTQAVRDAPSALNTVIVPNVTLPKVFTTSTSCHPGWRLLILPPYRISTIASTRSTRKNGTTNCRLDPVLD